MSLLFELYAHVLSLVCIFYSLKTCLEKCSMKEAKGSHTLCGEHFEDKYFFNPTTKNRLVWNANPTIFQGKPSTIFLAKVFYYCQLRNEKIPYANGTK